MQRCIRLYELNCMQWKISFHFMCVHQSLDILFGYSHTNWKLFAVCLLMFFLTIQNSTWFPHIISFLQRYILLIIIYTCTILLYNCAGSIHRKIWCCITVPNFKYYISNVSKQYRKKILTMTWIWTEFDSQMTSRSFSAVIRLKSLITWQVCTFSS